MFLDTLRKLDTKTAVYMWAAAKNTHLSFQTIRKIHIVIKKNYSSSESDFTVRIIRQQYSKKCSSNNKFNKSVRMQCTPKLCDVLSRDWVWFLIHIHDKLKFATFERVCGDVKMTRSAGVSVDNPNTAGVARDRKNHKCRPVLRQTSSNLKQR